MKKDKQPQWIPTPGQIRCASKDVAWEYAALLAAALEMAKGPTGPINHLVQEAFLVHVRNLAEFFRSGVQRFKQDPSRLPPRFEERDNIFAVDFCSSVLWDVKPFGPEKKLIKAINKTLSHMTYSRDLASQIDGAFDGYLHAHGTVRLMRRTWERFLASLRPEYLRPQCPEDIEYWLGEHTKAEDEYGLRVQFSDFENQFETEVKKRQWKLNQTPDGPV